MTTLDPTAWTSPTTTTTTNPKCHRDLGYFESVTAANPQCVVCLVAVLAPEPPPEPQQQQDDDDDDSSTVTAANDDAAATLLRPCVAALARRHPHLRCLLEQRTSTTTTTTTTSSSSEGNENGKDDETPKGWRLRLREDGNVVVDEDKVAKAHLEIIDTDADADNDADADADDDEYWQTIVRREANIGFDLEGSVPYWKVILVRGSSRHNEKTNNKNNHHVVILKYHHCIADGKSGYILMHDLLSAWQRQLEMMQKKKDNDDNGHEFLIPREPAVLPLNPTVDEMCFPPGYERTAEEEIVLERAIAQARDKRQTWQPKLPYDPHPPALGNGKNEHGILFRDGANASSQSLRRACRQRHVTVGSVLGAAAFFAMAKLHPQGTRTKTATSDDSQYYWDLDFDMDVDLRNRFPCPLGNDHVGAFIGMMTFSMTLTPATTFWGLAANIRARIASAMQEKQHFDYLEVNKRLDAEEKEAKKQSTSNDDDNDGHGQDMNFSNLGPYPYSPDYGPAGRIAKIYCVGGGWCPTFGGYVFLTPSVPGGAMNYALVYEKSPRVNDQVAQTFFDAACHLTERAATADMTSDAMGADFTLQHYLAEK